MTYKPETLRDQGTSIVFGVDQEPFDAGLNRFCLAYPLMVEETGELLDPSLFRNRGRLWWMVNDVASEELEPGCLHVGKVEDAKDFDPLRLDKDAFQIQRSGRAASSDRWAEIVTLRGPMPSIDELRLRGLALERRPWKVVMVRFDDAVLGPFMTIWSGARKRAFVRRYDMTPVHVPRERLAEAPEIVALSWTAGKFERRGDGVRDYSSELIPRDALPTILQGGEPLDFTPLEHVVTRLAKRLQTAQPDLPLHAATRQRLEALAEEGEGGDDRIWVQRLLTALRDLARGTGLAQDFTNDIRQALGRFLPPAEPEPELPVAQVSVRSASTSTNELGFLDLLLESIAAEGLHFDARDVLAFHLGLKSSQWSVLAGRSGVGKSTLPRLYARALGRPDSLLMVPVRPDWLDDRDVVGAYDTLSRRFVPAPSGLVDYLIEADAELHRDGGGLRLILLDEMNLSRVEYYFASFLSLLELPPQERVLRLFSPSLAAQSDPYGPHAHLRLPVNLRIVGTVNVDETTHFFSPKVLDRACVQVLSAPDLLRGAEAERRAFASSLEPIDWPTWESWIGDRHRLEGWVTERLMQVNEQLVPLRSDMGHRTFQRCLDFVAGAQGLGDLLSLQDALDVAVLQFVLPRLRTDPMDFAGLASGLLQVLLGSELNRSREWVERMIEAEGQGDFWQLL